jgi:hypothetical protein
MRLLQGFIHESLGNTVFPGICDGRSGDRSKAVRSCCPPLLSGLTQHGAAMMVLGNQSNAAPPKSKKNSPGRYARGLNSIPMVNREEKAGLYMCQKRAATCQKTSADTISRRGPQRKSLYLGSRREGGPLIVVRVFCQSYAS